jgi:hypothetical protein
MAEEKFSPEQSLQLIRSMIDKTKQDISDNGIYFLVWGWLTFIACTSQFVLKHIYEYERHYIVWSVTFIGIIFSWYQGRKDEKTAKAKTYVSESMKYLWIGMAISFFVLSLILTRLGWGTAVFPFFMMLYGLGSFVSGCIIRFKPLIVGGIMAWCLAIASTFTHYDYQMLFGAAAILVSYIIPAYMLRIKSKSDNK